MSEKSRNGARAFATATLLTTMLSGCGSPKHEATPTPSPREACPASRITQVNPESPSNGQPIFSVVGGTACNLVRTYSASDPYPFPNVGTMSGGEQFVVLCKGDDKPARAEVHLLAKPQEGPERVNVLLSGTAAEAIAASNAPIC